MGKIKDVPGQQPEKRRGTPVIVHEFEDDFGFLSPEQIAHFYTLLNTARRNLMRSPDDREDSTWSDTVSRLQQHPLLKGSPFLTNLAEHIGPDMTYSALYKFTTMDDVFRSAHPEQELPDKYLVELVKAAQKVEVTSTTQAKEIVDKLELDIPDLSITFIGGSHFDNHDIESFISQLTYHALYDLVEDYGLSIVVTAGATSTGTMRIVGQALLSTMRSGRSFDYLAFAAKQKVYIPRWNGDAIQPDLVGDVDLNQCLDLQTAKINSLDVYNGAATALIVTDGDITPPEEESFGLQFDPTWITMSNQLLAIGDEVAERSIYQEKQVVLVGGGTTTFYEMSQELAKGHILNVIAASGRLADAITYYADTGLTTVPKDWQKPFELLEQKFGRDYLLAHFNLFRFYQYDNYQDLIHEFRLFLAPTAVEPWKYSRRQHPIDAAYLIDRYGDDWDKRFRNEQGQLVENRLWRYEKSGGGFRAGEPIEIIENRSFFDQENNQEAIEIGYRSLISQQTTYYRLGPSSPTYEIMKRAPIGSHLEVIYKGSGVGDIEAARYLKVPQNEQAKDRLTGLFSSTKQYFLGQKPTRETLSAFIDRMLRTAEDDPGYQSNQPH